MQVGDKFKDYRWCGVVVGGDVINKVLRDLTADEIKQIVEVDENFKKYLAEDIKKKPKRSKKSSEKLNELIDKVPE